MLELVVAVSAAVLISAMCSLFEAVLYSVPLSHIESMAAEGRRAGRILQRLRQDVDRPISAILSLNTIANTAGAAIAGAAALKVFGNEWMVTFSAFFTLAILMFSEVIPKTAGVVYNRTLSILIARPLNLLVVLFTPFIWLTGLVTRLISRGNVHDHVSQDELLSMARMGLKAGSIEADEAEVIQNVLSLQGKTVSEIMTPRTVAFSLSADATLQEAKENSRLLNHSRIPVFDKDAEDVVGMVLRHDLLTALADGRGKTRVEELMRPVDFVAQSLSVHRLLRMLMDRRQHMLMVVDEFGGLVGLVSLEDVLEEILGKEIVDESDQVADLRELARQRRQKTLGGGQSGG